MSVRSFRPVMSVATVAVAALGCYMVSLRVAAERAGLENVENEIVLAQRDIRTLQTEIGTRGRLEQLERWNVKVLALSAPKADQFVEGGYQLARLARPSDEVDMSAPVVLAASPKPAPAQPIADNDADVADSEAPPSSPSVQRATHNNNGAAGMLHVASYHVPTADRSPAPGTRENLRKSTAAGPATTKPAKIATATKAASLPSARHDAKASSEPTRTGAPKDKATH